MTKSLEESFYLAWPGNERPVLHTIRCVICGHQIILSPLASSRLMLLGPFYKIEARTHVMDVIQVTLNCLLLLYWSKKNSYSTRQKSEPFFWSNFSQTATYFCFLLITFPSLSYLLSLIFFHSCLFVFLEWLEFYFYDTSFKFLNLKFWNHETSKSCSRWNLSNTRLELLSKETKNSFWETRQ